MLLADNALFTKEHYEAHRGVATPSLCELVVHCLELVSQLSHAGLKYRFKGGNSQLVLLDVPERFSIDVDIVTTVEKDTLVELVHGVVDTCDLFTRCEPRPHKTKPWLPIMSFRLFFESAYPSDEEPFVILDAVLEPPPYGGVEKQVKCEALYTSESKVELPTVSGLLADKMLCISPATVGIPLGKNKEGHRLKHVFDVDTLARHEPDWPEVESALLARPAQENAIQKTEHGFEEVADDTIAFCNEVIAHHERPSEEGLVHGTYLDEIVHGFPEVDSFLFRRTYDWGRFRTDCQRVIDTFEQLRTQIK